MLSFRTKNRKATNAVLTTIIVLAASIVLGTGVVLFSTGLFQTGGQQQIVESIPHRGAKINVQNNPTVFTMVLPKTCDKIRSDMA